MARSVEVAAPAKINLFLGVGGVRDDGYHDVVTVLHALELADRVVVSESDALSVTTSPDLGLAEEDNLAWRAAARFAEAMGVPAAADIRVEKHVPHGAGLGGGSSDAAAVIAGLCRLYGIDSGRSDVLDVAATVGADVPFFLTGPAALMEGRGDVLARSLPPVRVPIVLIKPERSVATSDAYREFDRHPVGRGDPTPMIAGLERGRLDAAAISNNLQAASVALVPESGDALALASSSTGVRASTISGSGSAVFAICSDPDSAGALARRAAERGWWSISTWTSVEGMTVAETGDGR